MTTLLGAGIAVLVAMVLNVIATVRVARSYLYTQSQKRMQLGLIWIVPLAGAVLVLAVMMSDRSPPNSRGVGNGDTSDSDWIDRGHHTGGHGDGGHGGDGGIGGH